MGCGCGGAKAGVVGTGKFTATVNGVERTFLTQAEADAAVASAAKTAAAGSK